MLEQLIALIHGIPVMCCVQAWPIATTHLVVFILQRSQGAALPERGGAQSQAAHELRDRALVYAFCFEDRLIWGSHP